jgi:hypothetical protein
VPTACSSERSRLRHSSSRSTQSWRKTTALALGSRRRRRIAPDLAATAIALSAARSASADHSGSAALTHLSPLAVGLLSGVLALAIGLAVMAIVVLLAKKPPRAR